MNDQSLYPWTEPDGVWAWHWLAANRRLSYEPNKHVVVHAGQRLIWPGQVKVCRSGLHASMQALDALKYAPGLTICRVILGGLGAGEQDKCVGRVRQCVAMADATDTVVRWAFGEADIATRVHAPLALRAAGQNDLAQTLEALDPITDRQTAHAARNAASLAAHAAAYAASLAAYAASLAAHAALAADAARYDNADAARHAGHAANFAARITANPGVNNRLEVALKTLLGIT